MSLLRTNLLNKALNLIPGETYTYYQYTGETVNSMGIAVPTYADGVTVKGSVQSPENAVYQQMGLSLDKNYKIFYGSIDIKGNALQPQPDRFVYNGATYEVIRNAHWFVYDGWCGVLAVEIKNDRLPKPTPTPTPSVTPTEENNAD